MKKILIAALIIFLFLCGDILWCCFYPNVAALRKKTPKTTAFIEYRKKQWEDDRLVKSVDKRWVPLKKISPFLIKAVIISEDDKFWRHEGFDFGAMQKAFEKDLAQGKLKAGGSTISQQLAKNLFLSPSKNPIRKIKEAIYTKRLEHNLSKKRIMELYLNIAEWGDGIFGIEAAALHHYGKHAISLTAQEAVRLASVLPNPIIFNPKENSKYVANHSALIYRIMLRRGIVIPEYDEVMNGPEEKTEGTVVNFLGGETSDNPGSGADLPSAGTAHGIDSPDVQESVPDRETGNEKPGRNDEGQRKDDEQ